jgi:hypothetical protein
MSGGPDDGSAANRENGQLNYPESCRHERSIKGCTTVQLRIESANRQLAKVKLGLWPELEGEDTTGYLALVGESVYNRRSVEEPRALKSHSQQTVRGEIGAVRIISHSQATIFINVTCLLNPGP